LIRSVQHRFQRKGDRANPYGHPFSFLMISPSYDTFISFKMKWMALSIE
jgi:hypothetical protein